MSGQQHTTTCGESGGTTRDGTPCGRPAGWGTTHSGEGLCRDHEAGGVQRRPGSKAARSQAGETGKAKKTSYGAGFFATLFAFAAVAFFIGARGMDELGMKVLMYGLAGVSGLVMSLFFGLRAEKMQDVRDESARSLLDDQIRGVRRGEIPVFFLYLRSFSSTGKLHVKSHGGWFSLPTPRLFLEGEFTDLEVALGRALEPAGPLIALGLPGEHVGAGRIKSEEEGWKDDVRLLAKKAQAIFVVPSDHPGTIWEIEWLKSKRQLKKTIFIMPPKSRGSPRSDFDIRTEWQKAAESLQSLGIAVPEYDKKGMVLTVGGDGGVASARRLRFHDKDEVLGAVRALVPRHS